MRRKARRGGGRQAELTIESLGGRGDGVAIHEGKPVFVPFTLPGESVRVRLVGERSAGFKAELVEIGTLSPERVEPPCPHFGPCGGCAVQHLADAAYRRWTRDQVVQALERRGFASPPVGEPLFVPLNSRRRTTLAAQLSKGGALKLGFHGRESHTVEDIRTCYILRPELMALLSGLRTALKQALTPGETADVALLASESGIDLLLTSKHEPGLAGRQALAALAEAADLARISWSPARPAGDEPEIAEPLAVRRAPVVTFAGIPVEPPPGGFVQPTAEGEAALTDAVTGWLGEIAGPVIDLYAGCGTFTFPLAKRGQVHAVEGAESAMASLWQAARRNDLAGRITAEVRDLAAEPLDAEELEPFAAAVFDPPRAGAKGQAEALARSEVPVVVALSCNPNTFGRDARALADGGYRLEEVRPIDQFPWSGHVELAALFRR